MIGTGDAPRPRPRRLWLTLPLYVVLLAVMAGDIWAGVFWATVGGRLGLSIAAPAGVVILLLGSILLVDVRRQLRLGQPPPRPSPSPSAPAGTTPPERLAAGSGHR